MQQGFVPSAACWAFLAAEALVIAEINQRAPAAAQQGRRERRQNRRAWGPGAGGDLREEHGWCRRRWAIEQGGHLATAIHLHAWSPTRPSPWRCCRAWCPSPSPAGAAFTDRVNQLLTFVMVNYSTQLSASCGLRSFVRTDVRAIHELPPPLFKTDHACIKAVSYIYYICIALAHTHRSGSGNRSLLLLHGTAPC